jgi:SAM-dependent methyltransferase
MATGVGTCIACGGGAFSEIDYPARGVPATAIRFECIRICAACGLGQALPCYPQSTLDAYYANGDYWGGPAARDARQVLHERNQCRHRVDIALPLVAKKNPLRVLDVGAGHGWIADWLNLALRGRALVYEFVEPDSGMSALIGQRVTGASLKRLRGWDEAGSGYDLIFLNHVLEHVAAPLDVLAQVKLRLAPGAAAYIEVPNADHRFKQNVFPHTFFFTPDAFAHLGTRAGLVVLDCAVFGHQPAGAATLPLRAAYRLAASVDLRSLAGWLDDRLWRYRPAPDGMWIRWLISRAA